MRIHTMSGCMLLLALMSGALGAADPEPLPTSAEVQGVVREYFAGVKDYEPGDLITRGQVEAVLAQLKEAGWEVSEAKELTGAALPDGSFLPQQLSSRKGRRFMRQISKFPGGYDRLERLSQLPDGRRIVRKLIEGPDGYKMVEYLTSTRGGKNLGRMLSRTPRGKGFNKPTRKIYTEQELLERLEESRVAELERRGEE